MEAEITREKDKMKFCRVKSSFRTVGSNQNYARKEQDKNLSRKCNPITVGEGY